MMRMKHTVLAAAALGLLSTGASAVDWGGYTRIGPGQKQGSGDGRKCFNGGSVLGHGGIGRLGNECNTYGEFALSQTTDLNGVKYKALLMTNFSNDGSDIAAAPGDNSTNNVVRVNQLYVEGSGYDIAPSLTFWIGRRFYHRADVHMDDAFYVDMSGTGAGVDDINPGIGTLSIAFFRTNDAVGGPLQPTDRAPASRVNVDWQKIDVNPGGKLRATLTATKAKGENLAGQSGKSGFGLSLQHNQTIVAGTEESVPAFGNTAWLQYAQGSASINGNTADNVFNGSDVKTWEIVDSIAWLKGQITGQTLFQFGQQRSDDKSDATGGSTNYKFYGVAGRGAYAITPNFKLQAELGFTSRKPDEGLNRDRQNITKLTVAPTLTVGQDYYSRPELRFYVSGFSYNAAYRDANGQSKKSKVAAGFQAEIWF